MNQFFFKFLNRLLKVYNFNYRIDKNININQKHIGDILLEVNGVSTKNASIDCISDIVSHSDKIVQVQL